MGFINKYLFDNNSDAMIFRFIYACCNTNNDGIIMYNGAPLTYYFFDDFFNVSINMKTRIKNELLDCNYLILKHDKYYINRDYYSKNKNSLCDIEINEEEIIRLYLLSNNRCHKKLTKIMRLARYSKNNIINYSNTSELFYLMGYDNVNLKMSEFIDSLDLLLSNNEPLFILNNHKCFFNSLFIKTTNDEKALDKIKEKMCIDLENNSSSRKGDAYNQWVSDVKNRDGKCVICERSDISLEAHHILSYKKYKELRTDIHNGITLCECHHSPMILGGFHQIYGTKGFTKEQLQEYINNTRHELGFSPISIDDIVN